MGIARTITFLLLFSSMVSPVVGDVAEGSEFADPFSGQDPELGEGCFRRAAWIPLITSARLK